MVMNSVMRFAISAIGLAAIAVGRAAHAQALLYS